MVYYWGVFVPALNRARRRARMNYHQFLLRSRKQSQNAADFYPHPHGSDHHPRRELLLDRFASLLACLSPKERRRKREADERSLQLIWRDMNRRTVMQSRHSSSLYPSSDQGRKDNRGDDRGEVNVNVNRDVNVDVSGGDSSLGSLLDLTHLVIDGASLPESTTVPEGDHTIDGEKAIVGDKTTEKGNTVISQIGGKNDVIKQAPSMPTTTTPPSTHDASVAVAVAVTTKRNNFLDRFTSHVDAHTHQHEEDEEIEEMDVYVFPVELSRMRCQGRS